MMDHADGVLSAFYDGSYVPKDQTDKVDSTVLSLERQIEEQLFSFRRQLSPEQKQTLDAVLDLCRTKQKYLNKRSYFSGLTYGVEFMMAVLSQEVPALKQFATERLMEELKCKP